VQVTTNELIGTGIDINTIKKLTVDRNSTNANILQGTWEEVAGL